MGWTDLEVYYASSSERSPLTCALVHPRELSCSIFEFGYSLCSHLRERERCMYDLLAYKSQLANTSPYVAINSG